MEKYDYKTISMSCSIYLSLKNNIIKQKWRGWIDCHFYVLDDVTLKAIPPTGVYNLHLKIEDLCTLSDTGTQKITILNRVKFICLL